MSLDVKEGKTEIGGVDKSRAEVKQYQLEVRQRETERNVFWGKKRN